MAGTPTVDPRADNVGAAVPGSSSVRRYRWAMIAVCAGAFAFMAWRDRRMYFAYDEWSYWTERHQLLLQHAYGQFFNREHNGHWLAVPMAIWWPLDNIFGAKTYLPYVIPAILAQCAAGYALFELLVYTRIRPAVAVAAGSTYILLGSAAENVSWGWNVCIVIPLACLFFGLLMVQRYADDRRRRFAILSVVSVLIAITSSGFGVTVVLVIASTALLRRRWFLGAGLALAPAALFFVWRRSYKPQTVPIRSAELGSYLRYTRNGIDKAVSSVVRVWFSPVAWIIFAAFVVCIVLLYRQRSTYWSVFAAPLAAVFFFYGSVSTQRLGTSYGLPDAARYLNFAGALLLPSFALLADRLWTSRRWMPPVLAVVLVWVLGSNVHAFVRRNDAFATIGRAKRAEVAATVALGHWADAVPAGVMPYPDYDGLSMGVVRQLTAANKMPCSDNYGNAVSMAQRLGLPQPPTSAVHCPG